MCCSVERRKKPSRQKDKTAMIDVVLQHKLELWLPLCPSTAEQHSTHLAHGEIDSMDVG